MVAWLSKHEHASGLTSLASPVEQHLGLQRTLSTALLRVRCGTRFCSTGLAKLVSLACSSSSWQAG